MVQDRQQFHVVLPDRHGALDLEYGFANDLYLFIDPSLTGQLPGHRLRVGEGIDPGGKKGEKGFGKIIEYPQLDMVTGFEYSARRIGGDDGNRTSHHVINAGHVLGIVADEQYDPERVHRLREREISFSGIGNAETGNDVDIAGTKGLENFDPVFFHPVGDP